MRSRLAKFIEVAAVLASGFLLNSCGSQPFCPLAAPRQRGLRSSKRHSCPEIDREPGGPFNSFDISWLIRFSKVRRASAGCCGHGRQKTLRREHIGGINQVANAGNNFSRAAPQLDPVTTKAFLHRMARKCNSQGRQRTYPVRLQNDPFFANSERFPGFGERSSVDCPGAMLRVAREWREPALRPNGFS